MEEFTIIQARRSFGATAFSGGGAAIERAGRVGDLSLNAEGYWIAPLVYNSNPYKADGSTKKSAPGDFSTRYVGDETDTSPYLDDKLMGVSTAAYIRNMSILIRSLDLR